MKNSNKYFPPRNHTEGSSNTREEEEVKDQDESLRVEFGELEAIHPFPGTSGKTHPHTQFSSSISSILLLLLSTRLHIHHTTAAVAVFFIPYCLLENCLHSSWRYYTTPTSSSSSVGCLLGLVCYHLIRSVCILGSHLPCPPASSLRITTCNPRLGTIRAIRAVGHVVVWSTTMRK